MELRLAAEVPRWALAFYLRHLPLVLTLSMIPAAERFTGQLWTRPVAVEATLQILTLAARILLLVMVFRLAVPATSWAGAEQRIRSFAREHWPSLLIQAGMFAILFILAGVVPEQLVPQLISVGPWYWAILLAIKNLTVIAFTLIWIVGLIRQLVTPLAAQQLSN